MAVKQRTKYPPGEYNPRAPRPHVRGPRPHAWKSGPDPEDHKRYRTFIQQRNQAQWRGETWSMTLDEWTQLWEQSGHWHDRGRSRECYCMTRRDQRESWTVDNAVIITRSEHSRSQALLQAQGYRSDAQKRRRQQLGLPEQRLPPGRKRNT